MFSINIDSSRPKPPAPRKAAGRGPINFDVTIDIRGTRRDVVRNLKRVTPEIPDFFINLSTEFVDLSVPSTLFQSGESNLNYAVEYSFRLPDDMVTPPDFYD
jgi:hypothetical protein